MAKIKRGYTRKEPSIGKASPHKDIPVLKDKAPDRPRRSTRGSKYRSASLSTFHTGERIIANAENKAKRVGVDYAVESKNLPLRFYIKDNPFVSKK